MLRPRGKVYAYILLICRNKQCETEYVVVNQRNMVICTNSNSSISFLAKCLPGSFAIFFIQTIFAGPKMLMLFCTGGKHSPEQTEIDVSHNEELQSAINSILEGLSECLSSAGTGTLVSFCSVFVISSK